MRQCNCFDRVLCESDGHDGRSEQE